MNGIRDYSDSQSSENSDMTGAELHSPEESRDEVKEVEKLAQKETRNVRLWKFLVVAIILITGAAVSFFTYMSLSGEEEDDYVDAFKLFATTVGDISKYRVQNLYQAHRDLAETITSSAISSQEEWPFVTVPSFEVHAVHARSQSLVEGIDFSPLVTEENRLKWEQEYTPTHYGHIYESQNVSLRKDTTLHSTTYLDGQLIPMIFSEADQQTTQLTPSKHTEKIPFYTPAWQISPPPYFPFFMVNYDLVITEPFQKLMRAMMATKNLVTGPFEDTSELTNGLYTPEGHQAFHDLYVTSKGNESAHERPHSWLLTPVFRTLGQEAKDIVGVLYSTIAYDNYLADLLPDGVKGIVLVLENTCGDAATYELTGDKANYLGKGDHHDTSFDDQVVVVEFSDYEDTETMQNVEHICLHQLHIYPSEKFVKTYKTFSPVLFTIIIACTFLVMAGAFFVYDLYVAKRNNKVVDVAAQSSAIVSSLFPEQVRDELGKMYGGKQEKKEDAPNQRLKTFLSEDSADKDAWTEEEQEACDDIVMPGKPLADLFPETTIMFGDIAGFTAWSSVRQPSQVFTLLETIYRAFDATAKKRRVFKVETIGDCYVAVCGLPNPNPRHALAMARFARDCLDQMRALTKKLEVRLGPDTGDLALRVGLHSGPVTAGVLRGEKSRFQLFGDTMNMAARMESNGLRNRIQISQETADLLIAAGKSSWVVPREEKIYAKGKGELQTFWLHNTSGGSEARSVRSSALSTSDDNEELQRLRMSVHAVQKTTGESVPKKTVALASEKTVRLVEWNAEVMKRLLKQIIARRKAMGSRPSPPPASPMLKHRIDKGGTVLDEVQEIIALPAFDARAARREENPDNIELDRVVVKQLKDFIHSIAALYHGNSFHSFEHASHVTMSVTKLMSRIVAPVDVDYKDMKTVHDHTYGITSDPLTQFACIFSALIHDVDHQGVPNTQLVWENSPLASTYKNKSVAEQNSVDLAWSLLMDGKFNALRQVIFPTEAEKTHFRRVVINSVMATDIMDKDLKVLRNARWDRAFAETSNEEDASITRNRKATIVIEHLIQASDISHTMQHWHIYRKWNERLFVEMYTAYKNGRSGSDPSENWYAGEIGFFDFYIIPLAKKLKNCGVFGVSSDEYLNYAEKNRKEWEDRGKEIVSEMLEKAKAQEIV